MRYWRIFLALFLVLLIGVSLVAGNLNQQLCCQAAPVLEVQLEKENLRLSVLNISCSVRLPLVFRGVSEIPGDDMMQQMKGVRQQVWKLKSQAEGILYQTRFVLMRAEAFVDKGKAAIQPVVQRSVLKIRALAKFIFEEARVLGKKVKSLGRDIWFLSENK